MNLGSRLIDLFKGVKLLSTRAVTVRTMAYSIEERGSQYSLDYRVYFSKWSAPVLINEIVHPFVEKGDNYVSPFHDVPLYANAEKTVYNAIMEIPRWSNAKMEVSTVINVCRLSLRN